MKKNLLIALGALLVFIGSSAHAAAVGSRGGKKSGIRRMDSSGNPVAFGDDVAWKVFESTGIGPTLLVDEAGIAPKQGMINRVCIGTAAATNWYVVYDSNTVSGLGITSNGVRMSPALVGQTTLAQCFSMNALFTSGVVVDSNYAASAGGGIYVYWRELGGYR